MKAVRFLALGLALVAGVASAAWAQALSTRVSDTDLRGLGVTNPARFFPIQVAANGRVLAGETVENRADLAQGIFTRLWVLDFGPDTRLRSSKVIPLKMDRMETATLSADGRSAVLLNRAGAGYWKVDLDSGELTCLFSPAAGKAGFMADPVALWSHGGQVLVEGYPYDEKGISGPSTLAAIDLSGGANPFQTLGPDLVSIYRSLRPLVASRWLGPDLGFIIHGERPKLTLSAVRGDKGAEAIGTWEDISGFWAEGNRVFFTGLRADGKWEGVVYDAASGKRWVSQPSTVRLTYAFLSEDGTTAVVTESPEDSDRMKVLYGRQSDGFQLHPVPGFERASLGVIRVDPAGRFMAMRNAQGFHFIEIPR